MRYLIAICLLLLVSSTLAVRVRNGQKKMNLLQDNFPYNRTSYPASNGTLHYIPELRFLLNQFKGMPRSYYVPNLYWREDKYLAPGLHPVPLDSQVAIEDRTATLYGLNLYDGATFEIALSLQGEVELPRVYERTVLYSCSTGTNQNVGGLANIKAVTSLYTYGPKQIPGNALKPMPMIANYTNPTDGSDSMPGAFYFRMISQTYITEDPLLGSYARSFASPDPFTGGPSWNTAGLIIWNDWKPITGENVWATMIGPLQNLYITFNGSIPMFPDYKNAPHQVQLGLSILPALMALQSPMGSLYHCPLGTQMYPADENEAQNVSNENNFSAYAAINMLYWILKNNTNTSGSDLEEAMENLQSLSEGLKSWFLQYSLAPPYNNSYRVFYQGGHVNFTGGYYPVPIGSDGGFAVDCQTWGSAVLGADFIDNQIAGEAGTAYKIWQQTKKWAGYYNKDGSIAGVGYTITNTSDIWSAEWTWGAVLMTRELSHQYKQMGQGQYASDLLTDSQNMAKSLRKHVNEGGMFDAKTGGYFYCNKRYFIPWGWYANAIPSTCSTAWAIMDLHQFNPFVLGGGPNAWYYQADGSGPPPSSNM